MKKNPQKQVKKELTIRQDIRRLGVLVECVGDDVKLIAEQYGDVKDNIKDIKRTLNSHTEMIGKIMIDTAIFKEDIEFIKNSLKKKIDAEEFAALERRVALLERRR